MSREIGGGGGGGGAHVASVLDERRSCCLKCGYRVAAPPERINAKKINNKNNK
jgi:hypothetical protein